MSSKETDCETINLIVYYKFNTNKLRMFSNIEILTM